MARDLPLSLSLPNCSFSGIFLTVGRWRRRAKEASSDGGAEERAAMAFYTGICREEGEEWRG
jgi:hypothetical protein